MKTISKKMLSVLMAVLVLLGGVWVSFAIAPAAENIAYDTTIDYSTVDVTNFGSWNYQDLGAEAVNNDFWLSREANAPGINPAYDKLANAWDTNYEAYIIYKVAGGTKFEATFKMAASSSRERWATANGEPFEFKIQASASKTAGWKSEVTTAGEGTDAVITYDVPADCEYVKITFPQKGTLTGSTARLNDQARLCKVRLFKVKPYDTVYDYSDATATSIDITSSNMANYGIYALNTDNAVGLIAPLKAGNDYDGGIGGNYGHLGGTWGSKNKPYVIYNVEEGTKFEVTFRMRSKSSRDRWAAGLNDSLEAVVESSSNATGGWKNAVTTASVEGQVLGNDYVDYVITYDVPADCNYVKITLPVSGIVTGTYRGNDLARIMGVKFFKNITPANSYDSVYDYAGRNETYIEIKSTNMANYGIYAVNTNNAPRLVNNEGEGNGINPSYGDLDVEWGKLNNAYAIYKVKSGTKFEANIRIANTDRRNNWSSWNGEPFEVKIEASANGVDGWKNAVDTTNIQGTPIGNTNNDLVIMEYNVPDDCSYVKITFPQRGKIKGTTARGNDYARLLGVKFFKYVEPEYDSVYDYAGRNETYIAINSTNMSNYGIYAINTNNAPYIVNNEGLGNGINPGYSDLNVEWGTLNNAYAIYKVKSGTKFEADIRIANTDIRSRWATQNGEPFEIKIESSVNGVDGWKNAVDTTNIQGTPISGTYTVNITMEYNVPDDCRYVKITFPQRGLIKGSAGTRANDYARLLGVKFFKYIAPEATYDTVRDYSDPAAATVSINGTNIANYGICAYNNSIKAPMLIQNENIGNSTRGGIHPAYSALGGAWGTIENAFVVYEVQPGTFFEATMRMFGDSIRSRYAKASGEPFEFAIESSASDMGGWSGKMTTSGAASVAISGSSYVDITLTYEVPADCTFVKITFPQKGVIPGTSTRANDAARLMKVRYTAAPNYYEGTGTIMNYKANGAVDFFYDNDASLIYIYKSNGIAVDNFSNGAAYVAPSMDYLNSGTNLAKPYVIYSVKPSTKFVAAVNTDRAAATAVGTDFVMKFYESANGANWTEVTTTVTSIGVVDYHSFSLAATTKYVKVEYPHTDAVKAIDKVNEIYGLMAVGFTPNTADYEIANPYGNYKFANVDKFYGESFENADQYDVSHYGIYEDIGGCFGFEPQGGIGGPYYYLAYTYGNLVNNQGSDPAGLVYSVKPGTAFQAVALLSRNNGDCQIVEKATGNHFDITVQISSDAKTWTDYSPTRILTEKHLMASTNSNRYITEVISIPTLPSDAKFVKLLYPQTASIKVMTGGAAQRAGNDFIGLVQVSYTKGNAVPVYLYEPDESKYENYYDFTESTYALDELNATGVDYNATMSALCPSWNYFYSTGENIRANCAVTVSVKEGSAFYLDFAYRPERIKQMAGENYAVRLLFSSDCNNWTDVTDKYLTVAPSSGALSTAHRFEIDKLPSGVKYVMVEYPHNRDLRGYVTKAGVEVKVLGNDNCGIKRIGFTAENHRNFEHEIRYGYYFEELENFPEEITEETKKALGIYDFTENALRVVDYTDTEAYDGRIAIRENYLYNKAKVDNPYIVYNVKPGTEFFFSVMTSSGTSRLTIMPTARMHIFASETGEDDSWTEITNYFYTDKANNTMSTYYVNNVGAKTNFIKIMFPNDGDLVAQGKAEGASGANFFAIKEVKASLVEYDPTWESSKNNLNFKKPELNNKVDSGNVVVNTFNWLYVIIPVAVVLVLAAAAVITVLIIKKKKKVEPQA